MSKSAGLTRSARLARSCVDEQASTKYFEIFAGLDRAKHFESIAGLDRGHPHCAWCSEVITYLDERQAEWMLFKADDHEVDDQVVEAGEELRG